MITRIVQVRFAPNAAVEVATVAAAARQVFPTIPGVRSIEAVVPADHEDWDLVLLVRFDDLTAVAAYRTDPTHVAFVDTYLKPHMGELVARNYSE